MILDPRGQKIGEDIEDIKRMVNSGPVIDDEDILICKCGCNLFFQGMILAKISQIKNPMAPPGMVHPVASVPICSRCGTPKTNSDIKNGDIEEGEIVEEVDNSHEVTNEDISELKDNDVEIKENDEEVIELVDK